MCLQFLPPPDGMVKRIGHKPRENAMVGPVRPQAMSILGDALPYPRWAANPVLGPLLLADLARLRPSRRCRQHRRRGPVALSRFVLQQMVGIGPAEAIGEAPLGHRYHPPLAGGSSGLDRPAMCSRGRSTGDWRGQTVQGCSAPTT